MTSPIGAPKPASSNKFNETIIVAEDSPPNQKILHHMLVKLGYAVIPCNDGLDAWNKLNDSRVHNVVAILSDMMMPNMDGISFLRKVRESEKTKNIPFVLITAVSDKDQILAARSLHVNGYILKPVTYDKIVTKLKELFPNKKFKKIAA